MITERQIYLEHHWVKYPQFPSGYDFAGRLQSIDLVGRSLQLQQKSALKLHPLCQFPLGVLQTNDWLALKLEGQFILDIILLAPCLKEPRALGSQAQIQRNWTLFKKRIQDFFLEKNFYEIQTPSLVICPGTEPFLDVFQVDQFYLPTSPELHLKKALAGGYDCIFEIKNCFRKGEVSRTHQPEFTMLEWYRSFENLDSVKQDCIDLMKSLGAKFKRIKTTSMQELFREHLDFQLDVDTSIEDLKSLCKKLNLPTAIQGYELWDDVFFHLFVEKIEVNIDSTEPLFLEKYPPSQAALARLNQQGWAERFELYWKGMEIANAFNELNDPEVQARRFQEDLEKKRMLGKQIIPLDEEFMNCLESGMPPSSGIALGVERLFMALNPGLKIQDLKLFPY